jgi:hypothetical protein
MKPNPKLQLLRSQLVASLDSFQRRRKQNKKKAFLVYLGATAISAVVTVLLGLQGIPDDKVVYIRNIALLLSATVTLLTGFDTFFNHRALWVRYTQTATQLLGLQGFSMRCSGSSQKLIDGGRISGPRNRADRSRPTRRRAGRRSIQPGNSRNRLHDAIRVLVFLRIKLIPETS